MTIYNIAFLKNSEVDLFLNSMKKYSTQYINCLFSFNDLKSKTEVKRLKQLESYINNNRMYKFKINIQDVLCELLSIIMLNKECNKIVLPDIKIQNMSSCYLYRLISFGDLFIDKSSIITDSLTYAYKKIYFRKDIEKLWQ